MTPVFSHGRLRLYLLKLLAEGPKHGYELIRLLENRFLGLYAPSAGTIYPRLQRLEAEGLVTHAAAGGRKVYEITDAGRAELRARSAELAELESDIRASVEDLAGLANEIQQEVRGSIRDLKRELREATKETSRGGYVAHPRWEPPPPAPATDLLERQLVEFTTELRRLFRGVTVDETAVRAVRHAFDTALTELRRVLR